MPKLETHPPVRPAGTYGKIANGVLDAFSTAFELVTCGRDGQIWIWSTNGSPKASFSIHGDANTPTQKRSVPVVPLRVPSSPTVTNSSLQVTPPVNFIGRMFDSCLLI